MSLLTISLLCFAPPPITGEENELSRRLDPLVLGTMEELGATAASLAVWRGETELMARGYGWVDRAHRNAVTTENTFRIASNTKPFTAATVRELIREGSLSLQMPMQAALKRDGKETELGDLRLKDVTVEHLLLHRGGWDRKATFDPLYRLGEIAGEKRRPYSLKPNDIIDYMLARPLQFAPGERKAYSNFGYLVLGQIIEEQTGQPFMDVVDEKIAKPLGISDLAISHRLPRRRPQSEVHYPTDSDRPMQVRQASGAMTTSPRSLCKFLSKYWITGEPRRDGDRRFYFHFGSLPNTTTSIVAQRIDGGNWALLLNSRRNEDYEDDLHRIHERIEAALDGE